MADMVDSAGDDRTVNNAVRHQYRVLSDAEKAAMLAVKDAGAALIAAIDAVRAPDGAAFARNERMLGIASERAEEAVMWACKHITA